MKKTYKRFKQGSYNPIHPEKYVGNKPPVYRSSYELRFFTFLDKNPNVIKWGSESIAIPYISPADGRLHHYYPDNIVQIKENDKVINYIIEIKPLKQTNPPKDSGKRKPDKLLFEKIQFAINMAKWDAAKQWCDANQFKFQIITEQELSLN